MRDSAAALLSFASQPPRQLLLLAATPRFFFDALMPMLFAIDYDSRHAAALRFAY